MSTLETILKYFLQNKNHWLSGEDLSRELKISRAAINKHISKLREKGFEINSAPRKGYYFADSSDSLLPEIIQDGLKTQILGQKQILVFKETDSTNIQAKMLAVQNAEEGTLVITEQQTTGRGRRGRFWHSVPGKSLSFSVILRPELSPAMAPQITLMIAVALTETLIEQTALPIEIKWPNDLLIHGRKLAGILTEISTEMDSIDYLVAGIGLNINLLEEDVPEPLKQIITSLQIEKKMTFSRVNMLKSFLVTLEKYYLELQSQGFENISALWKKHSNIIGKHVSVSLHKQELSGTIDDIDLDGSLLLKDHSGKIHRIFSGDIQITDSPAH